MRDIVELGWFQNAIRLTVVPVEPHISALFFLVVADPAFA